MPINLGYMGFADGAKLLRVTSYEAISRGRKRRPDHFVNPWGSASFVSTIPRFPQPLYHDIRNMSISVLLRSGPMDLSCVNEFY